MSKFWNNTTNKIDPYVPGEQSLTQGRRLFVVVIYFTRKGDFAWLVLLF